MQRIQASYGAYYRSKRFMGSKRTNGMRVHKTTIRSVVTHGTEPTYPTKGKEERLGTSARWMIRDVYALKKIYDGVYRKLSNKEFEKN